MSVGFRAVQWNRAKLAYDAIVLVAVALYLCGFIAIASSAHPPGSLADAVDIRVQAFGSAQR
jgi:methionine sulfoxide reductase heme-binding subunit